MDTLSNLSQPLSGLPLGRLDEKINPLASTSGPTTGGPAMSVKQFRSYQMRLPLTGACLLSGLTLALLSQPRIPLGSALNQSLIVAAYCVLVLGIGIRLWSIAYIHSRKSVSIVTTGPYMLCRNPLYVGTALIVLGYLLIVQSATLVLLSVPIMLLYRWGVIPVEEIVLRNRHQAAYDAYCAEVPRWFPRFRKAAFERTRLIWSKAVRRELECAFWWIAIAVLIQVVCSYRDAAWWMHPLMWP